MSQQNLSPFAQVVDGVGRQTQIFIDYLRSLGSDPVYTIARLPKPEKGLRIYVDDATGGGCPCYGDGANFRRYSNDAIVS